LGHPVDGFDLTFTARTSWKAKRKARGRVVDIIPVTWTKGRCQEGSEVYQEVWYQDPNEMATRMADPTPFTIALAVAKDYAKHPHDFREFVGVFEVTATGKKLSGNSIQTRVFRRAQSPKSPRDEKRPLGGARRPVVWRP
jgi:hypothetical protein